MSIMSNTTRCFACKLDQDGHLGSNVSRGLLSGVLLGVRCDIYKVYLRYGKALSRLGEED